MTYEEFKQNFLPEFLNIKSFNGKMKYANERLTRIGSGTGRVVYDIDGEKVLKLAKNPKGIAQNEAEAGAGYYRDTQDIVTIVFDSADNDGWLISEKAKKVNERRIVQLTGIPSLTALYAYLRNFYDENHGKRGFMHVEPEVNEQLDENEFAQDLHDFIANYNQSPGDYGRPSTYGEVLRDGQPTIVLTDYGLNDEVYDIHYNPQRKQKYRMYELYNFADGNDDMLSDMPPQDAVDTRQAMWGLMPYSVGDGPGVINEDFISFILNRDKYPTRDLPSAPYIVDEFHDVVNNLKETLEYVPEKKKFYNNLLELQDYLIRRKFYDREPLEKEMVELHETTAKVKPMQLGQEYSDGIANALAQKLNLGTPDYLGGGGFGHAYLINGNRVLKLTSDVCEIDAGLKIQRAKPKTLVGVYNVYKVTDTENGIAVYALIEDYIAIKPHGEFIRHTEIINSLGDDLYGRLLRILIKGNAKKADVEFAGKTLNDFPELARLILTNQPDANINQADRQKAYEFMMGLYAIKLDLIRLTIDSVDFMTISNLGYKDNVLIYYDIGGCRAKEPPLPPENQISLPEAEEILIDEDVARVPREISDKIANIVVQKFNYGQPKYVGEGTFGYAYDIGNNMVLKVTKDPSEANENLALIGKPLKYIAEPYKVFSVKPTSGETPLFVIILEKLRTDPAKFRAIKDRMDFAFKRIMQIDYPDVVDYYVNGPQPGLDVDEEKVKKYMARNPQDAEFFNSVVRIGREAKQYGVESMDYVQPTNLGYKPDGSLGFFDVGFGNYFFIADTQPEEIQVNEDSTSKFSTSDGIGRDNFPAYNNDDDSPMTDNNVPTTVDEEFIGHIKYDAQEPAEIYKNPLSLVDFQPDVRGLCDLEGNLFVVNNPYYILHSDLAQYLHNNGYNIPREITSSNQGEYIGLQRFDDTNNFYLGESFSIHYIKEFFNELKEKLTTVKRKNPNLGFVVKSITYAENDDINQNDIVVELNEDLEYHHVVGDATDDKYELDERIKSAMPGSTGVEIKKKCRLGGLGNTSAQCNWGDINAVKMKKMDETAEVNLPTGNLNGYESFPILNDGQTVGELSIIDRGVWGNNHYISIDKIFINKEFRGMGYASEAMEDLFEYADRNNIIITLTPDSLWGANKEKLRRWYQSLGFVMNKGNFQTMQLMYKLPQASMNEAIDASEAYASDKAIKSVLSGKRDVGFTELNQDNIKLVEKNGLHVIPVRLTSHKTIVGIIYRDKVKADRLYAIAKSKGGYLSDKTPEEAREIGQLLGYKEASIEEYIRRKYGNKIPTAPEPKDFDNIDEDNSQYDDQINKDVTTHGLNAVYVRTYKDADDTVDVYTVNGDEMRDSGFIEWVDGGNHWVDADLPKAEQKYAKRIPADDVWIDDVFVTKPIDFEGILLHERTESYVIKHFGYEYDDAHVIANKIELAFRKKAVSENITTDEDAERLASLMYVAFKKHFRGNKKHHKILNREDESSKSSIFTENKIMNEAEIILNNINEAKLMMKII